MGYSEEMRNVCAPFEGKRITVMGLGLLGRGVGDVEFLAECGAQIVVTDKKSAEELTPSVERLKKYKNITFKLGRHDISDFTNCDLVIKAAGVPLNSSEIAAARAAGVGVAMSTALFAKYAMETGATIVGITGTRGKSTVVHMIHYLLSCATKQVVLGGNVRGVSTLAKLPEVTADTIAVLELDSWQLQGFGDLKISPNISILTNLMPDHLNYYKNMDEYFADKANIFKYQKSGDVLITGASIAERVRMSHPPLDPIVPDLIPKGWKLQVAGEHNRENASLAAAALEALGISEEAIKSGLESFQAVEGRLQFVREIKGVKIYNDNNATTPEATMAAIHALSDVRPTRSNIILIVGGSDKGLPLDELVSEMKKTVSRVILLRHSNYTGSERLASALRAKGIEYEEAGNLENAVASAIQKGEKSGMGRKGEKGETGIILFSPAFASFGMFKNEYDRNDQFLEIIRKIDAS